MHSCRSRGILRACLVAAIAAAPACSRDGWTFTPRDADVQEGAVDAPADTAIDAPADIAIDAAVDTAVDTAVDAPSDAAVDAPADIAIDAPADVAIDAPADIAVDAPSDAAVDAQQDVAIDAPVDAPVDVAADVPVDTAMDVPVDRPTDIGTDTPPDLPTPDAPTDAPTDVVCPAAAPTRCGAACVDTRTDPAHCGTCGTRCAGACVASACLPAARPLAPLSTATVTSRRPTLRWAATGGDRARVDLCRDRALTAGCAGFDVVGSNSGAPAAELARGVWFWRVTARQGTTTVAVGPVWQFVVGARSAGVGTTPGPDTSSGSTLDVNGDGYADAAIGAFNANTAYVYLGGSGTPPVNTTPIPLTASGSGLYARAIASAGDVNGDGFADLVVGDAIPERAYVYLGAAGGSPLGGTPITLTRPGAPGEQFGVSVAGVGDVNGDGYADVLVGANGFLRAYVFLGGADATALRGTPIRLDSPGTGGNYAAAVAAAGDVNGDGYGDLAIGDFLNNRVYVYLGGADPLRAAPIVLAGPSGANLGSAMSADDINGDGYSDLAVATLNTRTIYAYLGGTSPLSATAINVTAPAGPINFGTALRTGDVNGDGFADVVVGTANPDGAFLILGAATAPLSATPIPLAAPSGSVSYGGAIGISDLNGDGFADAVIGASNSHTAYVHLGSAATPPLGASVVTLTGPANSQFGANVAGLWVSPPGSSAACRAPPRRRRGRGR